MNAPQTPPIEHPRSWVQGWLGFVALSMGSITINWLCHMAPHNALSVGYRGDSFFTLEPLARTGLGLLASLLILLALVLSWCLTRLFICTLIRSKICNGAIQCFRKLALPLSIFNAIGLLVLYWLLLSIVPQVFYSYYLLLFPKLNGQWVIGLIPLKTYDDLLRILPQASMAEHLTGLTAWVLLSSCILQWLSAMLAVRQR